MNRRVYDATPGRESGSMTVRFLAESSQIRKRAYITWPRNFADRIVSVGRRVVIGVAGATMAVGAEVAVPERFAFRAVTRTRTRKPRSAVRRTYVLAVAPAMSVHDVVASALQCSHWNANAVGLPLHAPGSAVSVWPTRAVPATVGSDVFFGAALAVP